MNSFYRSLALAGGLVAALAGCSKDATVTGLRAPSDPLLVQSNAPPSRGGTSTTTLGVSGCDFTVTYTWSGLSGRGLIASFGLYQEVGSLDESFNLVNVEGQVGKGGSVTHVFHLTAGATGGRIILGRGELVDSRKFTQIAGSSSASSTVSSTCG